MKWYKHDANANMDAKLRRVRLKYGMEGYGLYWYCLELIAQNVEAHNLTFQLEHDSEIISADTGIYYELVQEMMTYMVDLGLFEQDNGVVTCLKLAKRTDEYTAKLIRNLPDVRTVSGECPDKVPPIRIEQNRTDKNRREKNSASKLADPDVYGLNLEAWNMWIDYRRKAKLRKYTTDMKAKELAKLPHDEQLECVKHSIGNEYTGLFPDKVKRNETNNRNTDSFGDVHARNRKAAGLD